MVGAGAAGGDPGPVDDRGGAGLADPALGIDWPDLFGRMADVLDVIGAELYRIRVAVEVIAGAELDRDQLDPPRPGSMRARAAVELEHIGRLGQLPGDDYGTTS